MSSEDPTPTDDSKGGIVRRAVHFLVFLILLSPLVAIQGYLHTSSESVEVTIDDRVTYVTGMQPVDLEELEVDLGHFDISVVRPEIRKVVRVQFQLAGLISAQDRDRFEEFRETKLHRFRDGVITELTQTKAKHLADPRLLELRSQLMNRANDMVGSRLFRNLVFGKFSMLQQ